MKKNIYILILFCCLSATSLAQNIEKWKITNINNLIEKSEDEVFVINFWATFCVPCIEEIPHLIKYSKLYKKDKVTLYLVSLDFSENYTKIKKFVTGKKYDANIRWLNETDADYFCPIIDKSWSGAIPATLIVNKKSGYRKFYEKKLSAPEIEHAIKDAIQ